MLHLLSSRDQFKDTLQWVERGRAQQFAVIEPMSSLLQGVHSTVVLQPLTNPYFLSELGNKRRGPACRWPHQLGLRADGDRDGHLEGQRLEDADQKPRRRRRQRWRQRRRWRQKVPVKKDVEEEAFSINLWNKNQQRPKSWCSLG